MRLSGLSERGLPGGAGVARAVLAARRGKRRDLILLARCFHCFALLLLHGPTLGSREARDQRERQRAATQEQQRCDWEKQPRRVQEQ